MEVASGATVTVRGGTFRGGTSAVLLAGLNAVQLAGSVGPARMTDPAAWTLVASGLHAQAVTLTVGGVLLNSGTLTLGGVTVTGGKANIGGGINNTAGATLTLMGTTSVTGNEATVADPAAAFDQGFGGGVFNKGTLTVKGGSVSGNTGVDTGGGLAVSGNQTTMTGGTITGNTVTGTTGTQGAGGGVRMFSNSKMTASGGTITANTSWYGAGVFIGAANATNGNPGSDFTLAGATVSGNTARGPAGSNGGGLFNDGVLAITSGSMTGNTAGHQGGVFNTGRAAYALTGGSVCGNTPDNVFTG